MAAAVFWVGLFLVLHTYLLYPASLVLLDALRGVRSDLAYLGGGAERRRSGAGALPTVSLVVAAWNEAEVIGAKLENALALDYPADRLEVLIGSDASDDGTDDLVRACRDPRVRLFPGATRTGKVGVLNRVIPEARGELLVLSDANTEFAPDALRKLVRPFDDPAVGCVSGNLRLYNPRRHEYEESAYWRYESFLKLRESRRGAVMGANGGIYAIRRELFPPLPPETIVDDFVASLRCLRAGWRAVYEPEAVAREETTEDYARERVRRVRIAAGNFQALGLIGDLLHPRHGFVAYAFLSHKVLRWLAPFLLALLFLANVALVARPFYAAFLALQLAGYAAAGIGWLGPPRGTFGRIASAARYFVEMNLGLLQGFGRWVRGSQKAAWQRTARLGPPPT
jgi:cellulose synthase/poly-beta-1,6-N-acetylglucosamine synthase-like glycosyltransferase